MRPLGYAWLARHFGLNIRPLAHRSSLGTTRSRVERPDGRVEETYIQRYDPGDKPLDHLVFALKYDGLDLDLISKVFRKLEPKEVAEFVADTPSGKFARQIGFWFETLTGLEVPLKSKITGTYAPLLDPEAFVTAETPTRSTRWHVANNAFGGRRFLPVIRRTEAIRAIEQTDWAGMVADAVRPFPAETLYRALAYLILKESKSSHLIEHETPGASRMERFVEALHRAGTDDQPLSEESLTELQKVVLDPRYEETGFRTWQNYVGQTAISGQEIIHTIGVPPDYLRDVMAGLEDFFRVSERLHPVLRAAAISFPFVFIHPFEDGNGRIHRYLIHDIMARGGIGGNGLILPVSAEILSGTPAYDACLERFSKPLVAVAEYTLNTKQEMTVENPSDIEGHYRYPDVTAQAEYLAGIVSRTIKNNLPDELRLLDRMDRARMAIREIVDMPNRKLESLLSRLNLNGGMLGKKRRQGEFQELTDSEVSQIEEAFRRAFIAE